MTCKNYETDEMRLIYQAKKAFLHFLSRRIPASVIWPSGPMNALQRGKGNADD